MRITCPNCLAQYEIDGGLLPPEGREVQCSACDTIWFQPAPSRKGAKPEKIALSEPAPTPNLPPTPDVTEAPSAAAPVIEAEESADPEPAPAPLDTPRPRARALDPAISEVLRQEAEFEATQRKRDADPVEMQPDLGLLGGSPWPAFRDPDGSDGDLPDGLRADTSAAASQDSTANFPDIDDVSATLDPINARRQTDGSGYDLPLTPQDRQRGFLQGFIVPVALGGLVVGLYLAAPLLSMLIPPAAPLLSGFTTAIDTGRMALAQMILGR